MSVSIRNLVPAEYRNRFYYARQLVDVRRNLLALRGLVAIGDAGRTVLRQMLMIGKTAVFFPERPHARNAIFKAMALDGWIIGTEHARRADAAFVWQDTTFVDVPRLQPFLDKYPTAINRQALDISKRRVEQTFREVFGYGYAVDPTLHEGPLVEKGNLNSTHDGRILQGPITTVRPDYVYLKLLNNECEPGFVEDLRFIVMQGTIDGAYRKTRPVDIRFQDNNRDVQMTDPCELADDPERRQIVDFCQRLGLEYGEIDAIRDRDDGRLYLIDVNKTPFADLTLPPQQTLAAARRAAEVLGRTMGD